MPTQSSSLIAPDPEILDSFAARFLSSIDPIRFAHYAKPPQIPATQEPTVDIDWEDLVELDHAVALSRSIAFADPEDDHQEQNDFHFDDCDGIDEDIDYQEIGDSRWLNKNVPRIGAHEGAPPTADEQVKNEKKILITRALADYYADHEQLMGLNEVCRSLSCHKSTARPYWLEFKAQIAPYISAGSYIGQKPPVVQTGKNYKLGSAFTVSDSRLIDDSFHLLMEYRRTGHKFVFVSCNVPSDSKDAEIAVCESSDLILHGFDETVRLQFDAVAYIGVWERQLDYHNRLHIHALFAVPAETPLPTHAQVENLWKASLPPAAFIQGNGDLCQLKYEDVDVKWWGDFSKLDTYKQSDLAKKSQKRPRYFSDGKVFRPQSWHHISSPLEECAKGAILRHRLPARGRDAAMAVLCELTDMITPDSWTAIENRHKALYTVTCFEKKFPISIIPFIADEISQFVRDAAMRPDALPVNEALDFALISIHPSGLVILDTHHRSLRNRHTKKAAKQ